jgi:hypothetical protein
MATMLLTGLMVMAALVVDIGHMRGMRRANQSVVDFAALAAADALTSKTGPDAPSGCVDAVRYLRLNAEGLADLDMDCSLLPTICVEDVTLPVRVTASTDDYDVAITFPVADSMIADPNVTGSGLRVDDGEPCERLMVEVEQRASSFFAGIVGRDELTTRASAVLRQIPEKEDQVPSLWLLDPYECSVLSVSGGAFVEAGIEDFGGLISLDSDGSGCGNSGYTITVGGSGTRLHAVYSDSNPPGRISLHAMSPGQQRCDDGNPRACNQSDVDNGTLQPQPERRARRATRAPVDHRFNCRTGENQYPDYHGIPIADCEDGTGNYIDQLRAAVGGAGAPLGFQTWPHGCNVPQGDYVLAGNWFVDCNDFRIGNHTRVEFTGGNVVFKNSITMQGGSLVFNSNNPNPNLSETCLTQVTSCLTESSAGAAWVYQRGGNLRLQGGALTAIHTSIYQHDGTFQINAGAPPVWSAPIEGPFTSLSLWSEKSGSFGINGGAEMELTGIFFTPEADPFSLSGGAPVTPQRAQFISYRAAISGSGKLILAPLEIFPVVVPPPAALLIR